MKAPWKWSENGLHLIDGDNRDVLTIRCSDATEQEFKVIEAAATMYDLLREIRHRLPADSKTHGLVDACLVEIDGNAPDREG